MIKENKHQLLWITFGLITLIIFTITKRFPEFIESFYSRGVFLGLRFIWDHSFSLSPIPLIYLFFPLVLFFTLRDIFSYKNNQTHLTTKTSIQTKFSKISLKVLAFVMGALGIFYWSWGFNYNRVPLETQLSLPVITPNKDVLFNEFNNTIKSINRLRALISEDEITALNDNDLPSNIETTVRENLTTVLDELNYPNLGRARVRETYPKGSLIALGAAGIYIPFIGEGHFDAATYPLEHPALIAHEMSHGYGFINEGVCNFLAILTSLKSNNLIIRYSGQLLYLRYLAYDLYQADNELYQKAIKQYSRGLVADLNAIRLNNQKYQPLFRQFSRMVYNQYLKHQGVKEGIKSYNTVIRLYMAYKESLNSSIHSNHF